jgi:triosephosphate isomerase
MKKIIVANWKMNPLEYEEAQRLIRSVLFQAGNIRNVEIVICPPFLWLQNINSNIKKHRIKNLHLGAQNIFWEKQGAFTGEISPVMLRNVGVEYVIVGHSERRRYLGETDDMINKKVKLALDLGLKIILCVGENLSEHKTGKTFEVVENQIVRDLYGILNKKISEKVIVAYEPVWAIGSGIPETPENARKVASFIKKIIGKTTKILYGGSVNSKNIGGYLALSEISGALVGGASLNKDEFINILKIARSSVK